MIGSTDSIKCHPYAEIKLDKPTWEVHGPVSQLVSCCIVCLQSGSTGEVNETLPTNSMDVTKTTGLKYEPLAHV